MAHGTGLQWIYKSDIHIKIFKDVLIKTIIKYNLKIHAFNLMKNHYHMLVETPEANLSKAMKKFNSEFALIFNLTENRK